jgi:hypothetical protein
MAGCGNYSGTYECRADALDPFGDRLRRQRPGRGAETDIGFTGGGNNTHQVYISGITDHRLKDGDIVDHLVELVENKAAALDAATREEAAAALDPAQ